MSSRMPKGCRKKPLHFKPQRRAKSDFYGEIHWSFLAQARNIWPGTMMFRPARTAGSAFHLERPPPLLLIRVTSTAYAMHR